MFGNDSLLCLNKESTVAKTEMISAAAPTTIETDTVMGKWAGNDCNTFDGLPKSESDNHSSIECDSFKNNHQCEVIRFNKLSVLSTKLQFMLGKLVQKGISQMEQSCSFYNINNESDRNDSSNNN